MTKEELACLIDGAEISDHFTIERQLAKKSGLVIVCGASDDLMEFDGAWTGEVGCYDGGTAYVTKSGLSENTCGNDECPYAKRECNKCATIDAVWAAPGEPIWTYETNIPHATFTVYDDGHAYCRGIVFSVDDVEGEATNEA